MIDITKAIPASFDSCFHQLAFLIDGRSGIAFLEPLVPETERSMSLRRRIASGYFETALAREFSDQFRSGSVERHIRTSHGPTLVSSLHHPKSFGSGRRFPFEQSSNRLSPEQRLNLRRSVHHSQLRRRWVAAPKRLRDGDGFGVRSNLLCRSSEHSMILDISEVIRLAERLIIFPSFHRRNEHSIPPVRRRRAFGHDVSI